MSNLSTLDEIESRVIGMGVCRNADCNDPECQPLKDRAVLVAALRAVEAVHEPVDALMYGGRSQAHKVRVCTGCGQDDGNWQQWPCPTIRAIQGALP